METRYTTDAIAARNQAKVETLKRSQTAQSSMHLLLGLITDHRSPAAVAIREMGLAVPKLEAALKELLDVRPMGKANEEFRLTVECIMVERDGIYEALALGRNYVNSAHLLLSILRHQASPAAIVLDAFGITLQEARETVARLDMANSQ